MPGTHLETAPSSPLPPRRLTVIWFCTASSDPAAQTSANRDALNFLRALKGEPIAEEATIPLFGAYRRLNNNNLDEALDWFGEVVRDYLGRQSIKPPFFVIPMPDTDTTIESSAGPWTSLLAMAVGAQFEGDTETLDVLRWKKNLSSLRAEANEPVQLCENLTVLGKINWDRPVVLVDYLANAARVQACEAFLRAHGAQVVLCALAGRIVSENPPKHFAVFKSEIAGIDVPPTR